MTAPRSPTSPCKGEVGREAAGRGSRFSRTQQMTERARRLRGALTDAERKLWNELRRQQIAGARFRRQHPIGPYTLDFYCPPLRLAIEVDGGQHASEEIARRDAKRSAYLNEHNILVARFWNNEVLGNIQGVVEEIGRRVEVRQRNLTPSLPLPLTGGGKGETVL